MTQFKVGDRVRLKERYATAEVGTEGTVARTKGGLLYVDTLMAAHAGIFAGRFELVEPKDSPRVGDVVRVVLEGEVTHVSDYGFDVASENTFPHSGAEHVRSIEIIKPARPSVADLPVGSVVKSDLSGQAYAKVATDDWRKAGFTSRYEDFEIDLLGWTLLVPQASE